MQNVGSASFWVSIPLWFSRNKLPKISPRLLCFSVSIPLWFSRNAIKKALNILGINTFPYHYGSHATSGRTSEASARQSVSIPLWFSRNFGRITKHPDHYSFPYHYGSHATGHEFEVVWERSSGFPYHYGSHATDIYIRYVDDKLHSFHTTMVLTQRFIEATDNGFCISSFHTTMVLTQLFSTIGYGRPYWSFHTTMVLTQR